MGLWLRANVNQGPNAGHPGVVERIGSWDAGAIGYFSHQPVINLDGLVNSYEYYEAARAGRAADFLRCQNIAYLANHTDSDDDADMRALFGEMYGPSAGDTARVVYVRPFTYSGTTTGSAGTRGSASQQLFAVVMTDTSRSGPFGQHVPPADC
jgi:hypothetical protein